MILQTTALNVTQVPFPPEHEKKSLTRAGAREPGAGSREPGAGSREPIISFGFLSAGVLHAPAEAVRMPPAA